MASFTPPYIIAPSLPLPTGKASSHFSEGFESQISVEGLNDFLSIDSAITPCCADSLAEEKNMKRSAMP